MKETCCPISFPFTQKELARRVGVSERLWAEVERGERPNVSLETALRMLSEVGVGIRLDDPLGSSVVLHDPAAAAAAAAARKARATIRRATWPGRQIRLAQEGVNANSSKRRATGLEAIAPSRSRRSGG
ncbi:MAG: helix-turn-helix transcriptional regulator [Gemmatimonadaceae bacterium]